MLAVIVILVIAFMVYVGGGNGNWGAVAVTAVIGVAVLIGVYGARSDEQAVQNWLNSWKKGGKNYERTNGHQANRQRTSYQRSSRNGVGLKAGQSLEDYINEINRSQGNRRR